MSQLNLIVSDTNWAFLAGCLECDGSIQLIRKSDGCGHYVSVSVCNKSLSLLRNLEVFFGGNFMEPRKSDSVARLSWTTQAHVRVLLQGCWPYLVGKREEAAIVLEYCNASNGIGHWNNLSKERVDFLVKRSQELKHGARP